MHSGLRRRVVRDEAARTWTAELAVPLRSLEPAFDPKRSWRANFFRVEGKSGAEILFGVESDNGTGAEFSCAGGVWASGISRELSKEGKLWGIRAEMIIRENPKMWRCGFVRVAMALAVLASAAGEKPLRAQESAKPDAPTVKKVEPPNWWVGLTPEVMLLLSGKNLRATHVSCNLRDVVVGRTQSSGDGDYLFVWLKLGPELHSGTTVCRITTAHGETAFELPIAARSQTLGRNQGISLDDVIYLIIAGPFCEWRSAERRARGISGVTRPQQAAGIPRWRFAGSGAALGLFEGPGSDDAVADAGCKKRHRTGLPRLWRDGFVCRGSAPGNAGGLSRTGAGCAQAAHENLV